MKTLVLTLSMLTLAFSSISQIDSVSLFNSYLEKQHSVRVVSMKPNEDCLKTLDNIYIPSVEEYENDPIQINLFTSFLESRYKCQINFMHEDSTNGVRDMVFEVSQNKEIVYAILILNLSVIEQLYQEGDLIKQLDEYTKWTELIVNF
jgi:hypothetical protein